MTRSDPRSDFLSGKPPSSLSLPPLPPFYPSFDPPGVSRRTRTNVTRSNVTLIRFQCKTYDPPIMVRSHLARYSAAISDPNCIRETRRSNHRYWPVSEGRVNCTSDVTLTGGGGTEGGSGIIAATLISSHVASVTRLYSTPRLRHFRVESGQE